MQDTNVAASEENTEIGVPGEPEPETPPSEGEPPAPPEENTTPPVTADPPPVDPDWPGG